jgi:hypothetical protein
MVNELGIVPLKSVTCSRLINSRKLSLLHVPGIVPTKSFPDKLSSFRFDSPDNEGSDPVRRFVNNDRYVNDFSSPKFDGILPLI